jgi:predicted MPP superfamily phosphohydrolase
MAVRRPFLNPLWLLASLPGYIGLRLVPALMSGPSGYLIGSALLIAVCALILRSVRPGGIENRRLGDLVAWTGLLAMGFFSTVFVLTLLRDLLLAFAYLVARGAHTAPRSIGAAFASNPMLAADSAKWVLGLASIATLVGLLLARRPRLVRVDVPIAALPAAFAGFTIAQISDLHVGPTIKRGFVERIVTRVNALEADVIAVTGDLVDGTVQELAPHTAPLAGLTARDGVYFVTGNHEYYSGERAWSREVARLGLRVLKNAHVILERDGARLLLAGVTDFSAHHFDPAERSDPAAALVGAPVGAAPRILLAHQPSSARDAAAAGFDLQISGHTHGGQFWPWTFFVRYFQPFTAGLERLGDLWVYVSRGTGYWGPPNRFGSPSEITLLRLVPANALAGGSSRVTHRPPDSRFAN